MVECSFRRGTRAEEGQAVIEFVLVLFAFFGFVFFFVQLAMALGWSNYVQYATFMSARAYLSAGTNLEDQKLRAEEVLKSTLKKSGGGRDRFPVFAKGIGSGEIPGAIIGPADDFDRDSRTQYLFDGVRYSFRSRVVLPPFGSTGEAGFNLTSEAWLGREPSFEECVRAMDGALFDNGC
jgi:hypothetical protein